MKFQTNSRSSRNDNKHRHEREKNRTRKSTAENECENSFERGEYINIEKHPINLRNIEI